MVLDPGGAFAYIANLGQDSLSVFAPSTQPGEVGALQFVPGLPAVRTQEGPSAIEFFADQSTAQLSATALYAANKGSDDLSQFSASSSDGSLIPLIPTSVAGGQLSSWIEVRKDGDFAYLTNLDDASSTVSVYSIDTGGELSLAQDVAQAQGAISGHLSPGGDFLQLVQSAEKRAYTYPVGQDGLLGASTDSEAIGSIARMGTYDNTGLNFYVTNELDATISQFAADPVTGQLTPLAPATVSSGTGLRAMAVHPSGLFLYGSTIGSSGSSLSSFSIDLSSGALTAHTIGPTSNVDDDPVHLAVHPGGTLLYVACRSGSIQTYGLNTNPSDGAEDGIIIPFPVTQSVAGSPSYLRFSPTGDLLYVGLEDAAAQVLTYAVSISPVTLTLIDTDSTGDTTHSLALRPLVQ